MALLMVYFFDKQSSEATQRRQSAAARVTDAKKRDTTQKHPTDKFLLRQHSLPDLSHRGRLPDFDKKQLGQSAALALLYGTYLHYL